MHARWWLGAIVFCLSGCALLGPGADPDDNDEHEEGGASVISGSGGASGFGASVGGGGAMLPAYQCFESSTSCSCDQRSGATGRCKYDWTCCIESDAAARCECFESDACAAEVASRPGAKQVETCPANAAQLPIACAEVSENCTRASLEERGLDGCCDGLVCAPNASGVRTCRSASAAEIAFAEQCADDRSEGFAATGTLATSEGEIPIATAEATLFNLGADGCIASFSLALGTGAMSALSCALRAQVGPARDAQGRLIVSGLQLMAMPIFGCTGFPPGIDGIYSGGTAAGTLAFEGLSCEGTFDSEQCVAGRFTLTLDGELPGMRFLADPEMANVSIGFDNATLTLDGRVCDISAEGTACPAAQ